MRVVQCMVFVLALSATVLGAICGIGGGVIIKPLLDSTGLMSVSEVSFLSGVSVLAMSVISLMRNRSVRIQRGVTEYLAMGAAVGGVLGKLLFEQLSKSMGAPDTVGGVQALVLIAMTVVIMLYLLYKQRVRSLHVQSVAAGLAIGAGLGVISAFLGIGGGPLNLAVLFYCFSMDVKTAAKNSLLIILVSQLASLCFTLLRGTVPPLDPVSLGLIIAAGIGGGYVGAHLAEKMSAHATHKVLMGALGLIVVISSYNAIRFFT